MEVREGRRCKCTPKYLSNRRGVGPRLSVQTRCPKLVFGVRFDFRARKQRIIPAPQVRFSQFTNPVLHSRAEFWRHRKKTGRKRLAVFGSYFPGILEYSTLLRIDVLEPE